jgi:hypothetical protein
MALYTTKDKATCLVLSNLKYGHAIYLALFEMSTNITQELVTVMLSKELKQVERKYNDALEKAYRC